MNNNYLCVDIGTTAIKVIEKDDGGKAVKWGILERPGKPFHSNIQSLEIDDAARHLKILVEKMGVKTTAAVASVPGFLALRAEAESPDEKFIPAPVGTFTMSAIALGLGRYFLVAIPNDIAGKYAKIFQLADLALEKIEMESAAVARLLAKDHEPVLIADIGGRSTTFTVAAGGSVKYIAQTDFALASMDSASSSQDVQDVIMKEVERIAHKIWYKKIILCGGGAMLVNQPAYVAPNSLFTIANGLQR